MFGLFDQENSLSENDDFVKSNNDSPIRYELMTEANKYGKRRRLNESRFLVTFKYYP